MKLLLDTHVLIWFAENDAQLSAESRRVLEDESNDLYCSVASIWELAIKTSLGKLKMAAPLGGAFRGRLEATGFAVLPVEYSHAAAVQALPWHHRDPFDRLLVAQATVEQLALVSHDTQLDAYGVRRIF